MTKNNSIVSEFSKKGTYVVILRFLESLGLP